MDEKTKAAKIKADRMKKMFEEKIKKKKEDNQEKERRRSILEDQLQAMNLGEQEKEVYRYIYMQVYSL